MPVIIVLAAMLAADLQTQDAAPPPQASSPDRQSQGQPNRTQKSPADQPAKSNDTTVGGLIVNGARAQIETSIDRRSYSVANDLQGTTGTIGDVLRNIPSVQVDVQGNLSLRGDPNVTVLVDGKPSSQFRGDSLATALQSLPANQIDRIEVITNPSAEFRAEGSAGIINLITKKAKGAGGTGSLRAQVGSDGRVTASGNLGYNSQKLRVTADAAYARQQAVLTGDIQRTELNPTPPPALNQSDDPSRGHYVSDLVQGHLAVDYDLDARTRLSTQLRATHVQQRVLTADQFTEENNVGSPLEAFERLSDGHSTQTNGEVALILRHKWAEDHDLTLDATYDDNEAISRRRDDTLPVLLAPPAQSNEIDRINFNRFSSLTADYERSIGADKLKLGYDFEYRDTLVEHSGGSGVPGSPISYAPGQTDHFADDETDNQVYATYDHSFGKLDSLFGLRGEIVNRALNQMTQGARSSQDYSRLYPTLHLAYDLGSGKRITANYSKRIVRPLAYQLDPFVYAPSAGVLQQGNPSLTPQETDSYELGYEARKDAANFLATLYYRQTNNAFSTVYSVGADGTLLQRTANAATQKNGGLELVLANRLSPNLTYNLSANAYYTEVSAPNLGFTLTQSALTGFGRANLNWQVTLKDFLQLNVFVNGKGLVPQGYTLPVVSGNIGYRHTVNNRVSWMIVAQDPFYSLRSKTVLNALGGTEVRNQRSDSRVLSLTLVWSFAGKSQQSNFDFAPGGNAGTVSTGG